MKIDSSQLSFNNNTFDFVFTLTVLNHNSYGEQEKISKEIIRVLKDSILLIMEDIRSEKTGQTNFNMFSRTKNDWIELFEKNSIVKNISSINSIWWVVRDITFIIICKILRIFMTNIYPIGLRKKLSIFRCTKPLRGSFTSVFSTSLRFKIYFLYCVIFLIFSAGN